MFYVYEWFNVETNVIFYVGKGCRNRYKSTTQRNKLFKEYYEKNNCKSRIVKRFNNENDAFEYEHKKIIELKKINQCFCNLDNDGIGGVNFIWTNEMRKYKSKYNPMKSIKNRNKMSINNPMKNKDISEKVANTKKKRVFIKGIIFDSLVDAGKYFDVFPTEISTWCKRGYDRDKKPCRYYEEKQKQFIIKTTCSKKVIIDDLEFNSLRDACNYLGVKDTSPLCKALKNNKPYKGHICKYGNQQPSCGNPIEVPQKAQRLTSEDGNQ